MIRTAVLIGIIVPAGLVVSALLLWPIITCLTACGFCDTCNGRGLKLIRRKWCFQHRIADVESCGGGQEDKVEEVMLPCVDTGIGRFVIPEFKEEVNSGSALVDPGIKKIAGSESSTSPFPRSAFVDINLEDHHDVFGVSPAPSSTTRPASSSTPARFSLNNILNQFPNPPGSVPVWWIHRTPSRSKGKVQGVMNGQVQETPTKNTNTGALCFTTSASHPIQFGDSKKSERHTLGPGMEKTPSRDETIGKRYNADTSFSSITFSSPDAYSTPAASKPVRPRVAAHLRENDRIDVSTSPTLNIRNKSKSVGVFQTQAIQRGGDGDVLPSRSKMQCTKPRLRESVVH